MKEIYKKAEEIYKKKFKTHFGPSNPIWDSEWSYKPSSKKKTTDIERIKELLLEGYKVKGGWCASTMIRTYREYFFFYKKPLKKT